MPLRKKLKKVIFIAIIISFSAFFFLYSQNSSKDDNIFLRCKQLNTYSERYTCYKDSALSSLQGDSSMEQLMQYALTFPANRAHLMGHAIGRAQLIISNYNFKQAGEKCSLSCIAGYWHGIAEEWGEYAPSRSQEYINFVTKLCSMPQSEGMECSGHDIGHLYMSANKNLKESLSLCDTPQNKEILSQCILGSIHQNLIDDGEKYIFETCAQYDGRLRKFCYISGSFVYSRSRDKPSIENRFKLCEELNSKIPLELNYCYSGIGDLLSIKGETLPFNFCENLSEDFREICIEKLRHPNFPGEKSGCDLGEIGECIL